MTYDLARPTIQQKNILDFIESYIAKNGVSPTLLEVKDHIGVNSLGTVYEHLDKLESKGLIQRDKNAPRGIRYLINVGICIGEMIQIPMVGTIQAGYPIDFDFDSSETIELPVNFIKGKDVFALEVKGDSMVDAYVTEGDIVICEKTNSVRDGDMVAAMVDHREATLKRFFKKKGRIVLKPENPKYKDIVRKTGEIEVQGKVLTIIRNL
ncbi:transcriptional repressor LexA [Candidatus Dojkabacteria bacterium]|nr:transcriptional repressor LexA [Candidatus Dojkabacteria bacterium]